MSMPYTNHVFFRTHPSVGWRHDESYTSAPAAQGAAFRLLDRMVSAMGHADAAVRVVVAEELEKAQRLMDDHSDNPRMIW